MRAALVTDVELLGTLFRLEAGEQHYLTATKDPTSWWQCLAPSFWRRFFYGLNP